MRIVPALDHPGRLGRGADVDRLAGAPRDVGPVALRVDLVGPFPIDSETSLLFGRTAHAQRAADVTAHQLHRVGLELEGTLRLEPVDLDHRAGFVPVGTPKRRPFSRDQADPRLAASFPRHRFARFGVGDRAKSVGDQVVSLLRIAIHQARTPTL